MSTRLIYLLLLGVAVIAGIVLGRWVAKRSCSRFVSLAILLVGVVVFFAGQIEADTDRRFRLLAIAGLGLQIVGIVSSFRSRRTLKERSVELWSTTARH